MYVEFTCAMTSSFVTLITLPDTIGSPGQTSIFSSEFAVYPLHASPDTMPSCVFFRSTFNVGSGNSRSFGRLCASSNALTAEGSCSCNCSSKHYRPMYRLSYKSMSHLSRDVNLIFSETHGTKNIWNIHQLIIIQEVNYHCKTSWTRRTPIGGRLPRRAVQPNPMRCMRWNIS